jgi:hypothetical protein
MANVFEYIIITNTRQDYRANGTSHEDAMRNFVADPSYTVGFHEGNYEAEDGEKFIVVGPTQEKPDSNEIKRLTALMRRHFVFRTSEQIVGDEEVKREVNRFLKDCPNSERATLDAIDDNVPPHNKTATVEDITTDARGVWINGKRIPWSAVRGIAPS